LHYVGDLDDGRPGRHGSLFFVTANQGWQCCAKQPEHGGFLKLSTRRLKCSPDSFSPQLTSLLH
jgi:hypothetical protein